MCKSVNKATSQLNSLPVQKNKTDQKGEQNCLLIHMHRVCNSHTSICMTV